MRITKAIDFKVFGIVFFVCAFFTAMINVTEAENEQPTHCHVHQEKLKPDTVRILYGFPLYEEGYVQARRELFPFSNTYAEGGCLISEDSPEFQKVEYCSQCRKVEGEWKEARAREKKQ